MNRRWPSYLVPLKHDYPLGWRCASVLDEVGDDGVTIKEIAHEMGLDYYTVRRLERRGLIEPVATRRRGSHGRPELIWKPSPDGGYLDKFAALRSIALTSDP
jgi:hypothetical protein